MKTIINRVLSLKEFVLVVIDDGLYDHRKAFCKVKIVFIHPLYI